jgi:thiol-disulfide isomerase/thioredoxin
MKFSKDCFMGLTLFLRAFCLAALLAFQTDGATTNESAAPSDADIAWKALQKALRPPMPPAEWQGHPTEEQLATFRAEESRRAGEAADQAKTFYTQYPTHPKAAEARRRELDVLRVAVQLGNTNKLAELEAREQEKLNDPNLSETERFKLRTEAISRGLMAARSQGEAAMLAQMEKSGRELIKDYPQKPDGYELLLQVASQSDESKMRDLAKEIVASDASDDVKEGARGLLKKMDSLGKPLDIKFTAVDGREVDITKMPGKVVLVDFWATWCGPCVGEVPHVVEVYQDFHDKGFEIVGISFDQDKKKLQDFVEEKQMKWPQYFDGKGWQNKFGRQYGINSIPAMWLVDKKGNLRIMEARGGLKEKVEKLLAE